MNNVTRIKKIIGRDAARFSVNSISLYSFILFILVFFNELSFIYIFSDNRIISLSINLVQLVLYVGLLYVIIDIRYSKKEILCIALITIVLFIGYIVSGKASFFRGFLLLVASKQTPLTKIFQTIRNAYITILILSVGLWLLGISDSGVGRRDSLSIGFVHPNIAAQVLTLVCLLWLANKEYINRTNYIIVALFAVMVFLITGSKTSTIVLLCTPAVIFISKKINNTFGKYIITYSQIFIILFSYISARLLETNSLIQRLDILFTDRIFLNYYLFNKFGVKLLGQNVVLADSSVYNNIRDSYNWVITCDNTYVYALIVMGLIPTLIAAIGYIVLMKKAIYDKNHVLVAISVVLCVYSFCESQMIEVYSYFVYFYLFQSNHFYNKKGFIS